MPLLSGLSTGVKQGLEVQSGGNLKGAIGGEDGSVVGQPLHLARSPDVGEPLFATVDHHVPDHLAGDPSRCGHPADDLAVVAVQGKGNPHDLAIPAGEFQRVRTPTLVGAACHDRSVMGPRDAAPCMPGQQQAALLHQSVDALGVDRVVAGGSPLALEERGDPPVSIAWAAIHQATDIRRELRIPGAGLGSALRTLATRSLNQVGTGHPERLCDPFHGVSSGACDRDSKVGFLPVQDQEPP